MESLKSTFDAFISANPTLAAALLIGGIVLILLLTSAFRGRCPECGRFWAGKQISKAATSASRYRVRQRCRFCGHEWERTESRTRSRSRR